MGSLLVVESPNKAKKIQKMLGSGWSVVATGGHFRDLPNKSMGIEEGTLRPEYEIQNKATAARLRKEAKAASDIFLALDPDREGEAIAYHVAEILRRKNLKRVTYTEITKSAIEKAIASPGRIDMALVRAQEARRVLDRLVGYRVSPALPQSQTAGRVQSPALRLIVEREDEIKNFVPKDHFAVVANIDHEEGQWQAKWDFKDLLPPDAEDKLWTEESTAKHVATTKQLEVVSIDHSKKSRQPPPPFTTSTLQQAASAKLQMSPEQTMRSAQKLFEAGAITYHRTDAVMLSAEAVTEIRDYLTSVDQPVSDAVRSWKSKSGAQEAHESIRPTDITAQKAGDDDDARKLYHLIRMRTLCCQMAAAEYDVSDAVLHATDVEVGDKPAIFTAHGEKVTFAGWLQLGKPAEDEDEEEDASALPSMEKGDQFDCECDLQAKKTKAPPRYTEAALIKKLEALGIGRPSTYASTLQNLRKRDFVKLKARKLEPTTVGVSIVRALMDNKFSFMDYKFTKTLEGFLDQIAKSGPSADEGYDKVVRAANDRLDEELKRLPEVERHTVEISDTHKCPECGGAMASRKGKSGVFYGCVKYPECKGIIDPNRKPIEPLEGDGETCEKCGKGTMTTRAVRKGKNKGKRFLGCSEWKSGCDNTVWEE